MKKDNSAWDLKPKSKILNFNVNTQKKNNDKFINICSTSSISNNNSDYSKNSEAFQYQLMKDYKTTDYSTKIVNFNQKDLTVFKENKIDTLIKEIRNENFINKEYNTCLSDLRKKIKGEKDRSIVYLDKIDCIHFMKKVKIGKHIIPYESYSKREIFSNHNLKTNYTVSNLNISNVSNNKGSNFLVNKSNIGLKNNTVNKFEYKPIFNKKKDSFDLFRMNFE